MSTKRSDNSRAKPAQPAAAEPNGGKHADNLRRINAAGVPGSAGGATGDLAAADRLEARTDKPRNGYRGSAAVRRARQTARNTAGNTANSTAAIAHKHSDDERSINSAEDGDDVPESR